MLKTLTRKVVFHPYAQDHLLESPEARWSCRQGFILSRGEPPTETVSAGACRFLWVLVLSVLCSHPPQPPGRPPLLGWPRLILHPASHCENDDTNNEESNTASALLSTPILGGEALRCGANPALPGFRNLSAMKPWQHEPASPPRMKRDELTEKLLAEYGHIISVIHHPNPSRRGSLTPLL